MTITETDATLAEAVRKHIILTLASCGGNRTRAAKVLDISLRCLRDKLRGYRSAGVQNAAKPQPNSQAQHATPA